MADVPPRGPWRERPLVQLTITRYREFVREPEALFWTFIFPVILAAGLGLAFRSKPPDVVRVAVVAGAGGAEAAAALRADPRLAVRLLDDSAAATALRTGAIALAVVPGPADSVTFRFDAARTEAQVARLVAADALERGRGRTDRVARREVLVQERGSRYIDFLLPGLLAMNLMGTGVWGTGFTVVDQRRKRLLKRLVATPMSKSHYLASFILSRLGLLVGEIVAVVGFGVLVFEVPLRGSLVALGGLSLLAAVMFGGLGLLLAARPRTIEGASGLMNLVLLPMWVLSGVFFSASNFPDALQPFIQALPLTAAVDAIRANMLEGATLLTLAPEVGLMAAWTLGSFGLALRLFRWS